MSSRRMRLHRITIRYAAVLALAVGTCLGALAMPTAASASGIPTGWSSLADVDRMPSVRVDYVLDAQGGVDVTETIQYTFDSSQGTR
ncbi:MAG TPA: hypothetical protein P5181_10085, partial [Dermatophilaceae bacterium]|nr:hypothetical protein [Dermatophilaceae bacterium]